MVCRCRLLRDQLNLPAIYSFVSCSRGSLKIWVGVSDLDEIAGTSTLRDLDGEKGGDVGDAGRLLHVVGHKRNRISPV